MDPLLLGTAGAFGLASAAGLNTTLPLLLVGLAARFGMLTLVAPYDALASDITLIGLGVLAAAEIAADKVPGLDSIIQSVQWPFTLAAGAILFGSQQSIVGEVSPGLAILVGVLTAGGIHGLRTLVRPAVNLGTFGLGGPIVSAAEDAVSLGLTLAALLAPLLAPALAAVVVLGGLWLAARVARRRLARAERP